MIETTTQSRRFEGIKVQVRHWITRLEPYLLIAPALLLLALIFFFPAIFNVQISLQDISLFELLQEGEPVGLRHYGDLMSDPLMHRALINTVVWLTIVTVVVRLVLGLLFAVALNSTVLRRWRLIGFARTLMLLPWVTPPVVAVATWQWLLHPRYGAINILLFELGLTDREIPFLVQTSTVWPSIVVVMVWNTLPLTTIMFLAGLQSIPQELYEASAMDGANGIQQFFRITLPMIRPVIAVTTLITTIWTFNNFIYVWLTTRGGPGDYTQVLSTYLYTEGFLNFDMGRAATIGVIMTIIMAVFSAVYLRFIARQTSEAA